MPDSAMRLPPDLLAKLLALRPVLESNGTVVRRQDRDRRPAHRLRLRVPADSGGRRAHLSIALADAVQAEAVMRLIDEWRRERRGHLLRAKQAEQARREQQRQQRQRRQLVLALAGGGRRRRRWIAGLYDQACANGPWGEAEFVLGEKCRVPNRRPGRPAQSGLALPSVGAQSA